MNSKVIRLILLAIPLFVGNSNSIAQSQDHMWCGIIKNEMSVVQQQKAGGFTLDNSHPFLTGSDSQKVKAFKYQVMKIIYSSPDSGTKYINSTNFLNECLRAQR